MSENTLLQVPRHVIDEFPFCSRNGMKSSEEPVKFAFIFQIRQAVKAGSLGVQSRMVDSGIHQHFFNCLFINCEFADPMRDRVLISFMRDPCPAAHRIAVSEIRSNTWFHSIMIGQQMYF